MIDHPFIDTTLAEQLLEKAIAEKGEGHKGNCQYVSRDLQTNELAPSCIVGVGLALLGWTPQELLSFQSRGIASLMITGDVKGSSKAGELLSWAQGEQDMGKTWGEVLQSTRALIPS